jgi:hypothetical protein
MQVLDNDGHADGKIMKHRAGDLYDLISCSKETVKAVGEWNKAEIILNNGDLTFMLNGEKVVHTTMFGDEWKAMVAKSKFKQWADFGTAQKGKICLQDHGDDVFSNIEIPTTQKGYTKSDGEKVERIKGEVILEIDPKLTMSLFDMRQGYIHHISMIAKYSKKVNTPRLYIYLLRQMGLDKSLDVKVEFLPMKQYLGLVELDEHGNILLDDKGEPVMNKYPKFSQFRKQVLDVVREDLNRMASRSETDIVFDEFSEEDFIYRNGKHKGDPEYVIFHIKRTDVGINHIGDKDADIARRLNEKINRNRGKKTSDDATQQGDLFAHVYQNPDKKIEVDTTQGFEQWNQFISMVQDTSQQALLGRCKFIGIKNDRFCIAASDDDFAALKTSGLERLAQEFFDCVGSFMPVFYRG